MFQSFTTKSRPDQGPPRLAALRARMRRAGVDAVIVPRADAHQGEYVAPPDERLSWLTGFTGSAGLAVVTQDVAGVFVDGRYRAQVRAQVDLDHFTPVPWPETRPGPWIVEQLGEGRGTVAFDPWLHSVDEAARLTGLFDAHGIGTSWVQLVDEVWEDRPARPAGPLSVYPETLAGTSLAAKCRMVAEALREAGEDAAVLTLPDSIAWLLNLRGADIPRIPIFHAFAIVHADGGVDLFTDAVADDAVRAHLGETVRLHPYGEAALLQALDSLSGKVRLDRASAPVKLWSHLEARGFAGDVEPVAGADPCVLPKATKTQAEIAATREAHLRDGAAMVEFLAWLDRTAPAGGLTEIDVVTKLESCRRATNALMDISFDTICGAGPHGAIVHYRVTEETNRAVTPGDLLLVDSGGQYLDGTTDITRTMATGPVPEDARAAFTRVLQGMIAVSRARWPRGLAGRDLDPLARAPLWRAGMDFDHGTGHGVGVYLSVHEGPQRLSRISDVPLEPGMILSNEPGYYREGAFGIRLENLVVVREAPALPGGDDRDQLAFDTLTMVPIDTRCVDAGRLSAGEREWLNAYHAQVLADVGPRVDGATRDWLVAATAAI